jgi:hypothetical protein
MTVYKLCRRLHEVLPIGIRRSMRYDGLLETVQSGNTAVFLKGDAVRQRLRDTIERVERESAETVRRCRLAIAIMEGREE